MSAQCAPAEPSQPTRRGWRRTASCAAALLLLFASPACTHDSTRNPAAQESRTDLAPPADLPQSTLSGLAAALESGDSQAAAAFGSDSRTRQALRTAAANAVALGFSKIDLQPSDRNGEVRLTWWSGENRVPPLDVRLPLTVAGAGLRLSNPGPGEGQRLPVWWQGRLSVARHHNTGVAVLGPPAAAGRWLRLVSEARDQLALSLPITGPPTRVWIEIVPDSGGLERALGAGPGDYASLAGVTSAADGSQDPRADVRILLAAAPMRRMIRLGQRTLLAHELVHLWSKDGSLHAANLPVWWLEGRADHFALTGAPLARAAATRSLIAQLRQTADPPAIPRAQDFVSTSPQFNVSYALAWQACEALVDLVGEQGLADADAALRRGASLSQALRGVRTSREALRRQFRQRLQHLSE